jgi:hypothetical protein
MKHIFTVLVTLLICSAVLSQAAQDEPQRYTYHIWGNVLDGQAKMFPQITVCFAPSERPINGRIPCTKTDDNGNFSLTVKDIPDKYSVCASTSDSPFIILEQDKDKGHRTTCMRALKFGAEDECRKVVLRFEGE